MTEPMKFDVLPKLEDLLAAGICAASAMAWSGQGSPQSQAVEQLGAQIAGRVLADYYDVTNDLQQAEDPANPDALRLREKDFMTGGVRAGISVAQNRSNKRVGWDALRGVASSLLGRMVAKNLKPEA